LPAAWIAASQPTTSLGFDRRDLGAFCRRKLAEKGWPALVNFLFTISQAIHRRSECVVKGHLTIGTKLEQMENTSTTGGNHGRSGTRRGVADLHEHLPGLDGVLDRRALSRSLFGASFEARGFAEHQDEGGGGFSRRAYRRGIFRKEAAFPIGGRALHLEALVQRKRRRPEVRARKT
jgi:hypothetical protein